MLHLEAVSDEVRFCLAAGNLEGVLALTDEFLLHHNHAKLGLFRTPGFHSLIVDAAAAAHIAKDIVRLRRYMRLVNLPQIYTPRRNSLSRNDLEVMRIVAWYHTRPTIVPEATKSFFQKIRQKVVECLDRWSARQEEMLQTAIAHAHWHARNHAALAPYTP